MHNVHAQKARIYCASMEVHSFNLSKTDLKSALNNPGVKPQNMHRKPKEMGELNGRTTWSSQSMEQEINMQKMVNLMERFNLTGT